MESPVILGYWNIRGILGEVCRLFLEYLDIPYQEQKYTTMDDKIRWFEKEKTYLKTSFPNLPYLQDGSAIICESDAILFHLAEKKNRLDLFGLNSDEKKELFAIRGVLKDLGFAINQIFYHPNFDQKVIEEVVESSIRFRLEKLREYLGGKMFLLGENVRFVDFFLYETVETIKKLDSALVVRLNFEDFIARFRKLNRIENYLRSERFRESPIANPLISKSGI